METNRKVGIIACSGEELPGGTVTRAAARRVLELLRPQSTVTLCLPLFLAGDEQERLFAAQHPTIAVDGCDKCCARRATEKFSGPTAAAIVVGEILGSRLAGCHRSSRDFDSADREAAWIVADRIAAEVDRLTDSTAPPAAVADAPAACCACGGTPVADTLDIGGRQVAVNALRLIFDQLRVAGLAPGEAAAAKLLEQVRIYHAIEPGEEAAYCPALVEAYARYCQ